MRARSPILWPLTRGRRRGCSGERQHPTLERAAESMGISRVTAWRIQKTLEFQQDYRQACRAVAVFDISRGGAERHAAISAAIALPECGPWRHSTAHLSPSSPTGPAHQNEQNITWGTHRAPPFFVHSCHAFCSASRWSAEVAKPTKFPSRASAPHCLLKLDTMAQAFPRCAHTLSASFSATVLSFLADDHPAW